MPRYTVAYAFRHRESALRPDDQMWGEGTMPITTDKEPETQEDFDEIAKTVFRAGNDYAEVKIKHVIESQISVNEDDDEPLEGEIVID